MWRCKQVAAALADHNYRDLPPRKRFGLRLHVMLCVVCGRYHRQVMVLQDMARIFRRREEQADLPGSVALSPEARERLQAAVRTARPK